MQDDHASLVVGDVGHPARRVRDVQPWQRARGSRTRGGVKCAQADGQRGRKLAWIGRAGDDQDDQDDKDAADHDAKSQ